MLLLSPQKWKQNFMYSVVRLVSEAVVNFEVSGVLDNLGPNCYSSHAFTDLSISIYESE